MLELLSKRTCKVNKKTLVLMSVVFVTLLVFFYARSKYHLSNLDTDEGQYAYGAQEVIRGGLIYKNFHVNKPPGTIWIYVLVFKLLGESTFAIKLSVTITILATSVFVFLIAKRLLESFVASLTASFFLFSLSLPFIHSGQANSEVYMTFFIAASIYAVLVSRRAMCIFISGFLLGIAFMIKTVAVSNFAAVAFWLMMSEKDRRRKKSLYLALGFISSIVLMLAPLYFQDIMKEFWLSVFTMNYAYINDRFIISRFFIFQPRVIVENLALWLFGLGGAVLFFRKGIFGEKSKDLFLIVVNLFFSILLIQYMGRGFNHYYIQAVPFLAILGMLFVNYAYRNSLYKDITIVMFTFFLSVSFLYSYKVIIKTPGKQLLTATLSSGGDRGLWYDDSREIGEYIKQYINEDDYIYNLGREGQIYFYSKTRSPSRFLNDRLFYYLPETINLACQDLAMNKPKLVINTLKEPHFSPHWGNYVWDNISKCGNLKVERKEKYLFAEIWWIE
jgi:4-amino-4-deoxy-L-arabinose transferase-like glycosyltransferase